MKTHIIDFDKALAQARQSGGRIQLLLGKVLTKCPLNGGRSD